MSKFAPAGIKSSINAGNFGGMSLQKKKVSKSKMSLVDSENVRNMKSQQKHQKSIINQSKVSKESVSNESFHDDGSDDLEAELEKLQIMEQRKMGKMINQSAQNAGPRTLLNIDEIGPDFIDDSPNNSEHGRHGHGISGYGQETKEQMKKRSSTHIVQMSNNNNNADSKSQSGSKAVQKQKTAEKTNAHHGTNGHGNYEQIVKQVTYQQSNAYNFSSKKRISLEEKQQIANQSFKQQDPHGRSMREFEEQDIRETKSKRSGWSKEKDGYMHDLASTKHGGYESSRSKKEFYLNFEQMAEYHRNNEEEQYLTTEVRVTNEYYNRIIIVEYISVFFSTFGVGISMIINELKLYRKIDLVQENILLSYVMFSTLALVLTLYFRYQLYLKWYMYRGLLTEYDNLISTNWWHEMLTEQLIVIISPLPFLQSVKYTEVNKNWSTSYQYEINQILMCLSFARIYIHLRYTLIVSKFMNPRSKRVCTMNGCEAEHMFAIKSIMKQMPYTFISFTLTITIFLFGYQLKVFEGPLSEVSGQNFNLLSNAMWNVIITLTTTGYGDIYPKTNFGRFIGLIVCFWGTFVVSFFVVTVNNMLSFTASEDKSYTLLQRLHYKEELKRYAVNVLTSAYKHRNVQMREKDDPDKNLSALRKFRGNMLSFQQAVMRVRNFYEGDTETDILMRLVDNLREDVDLVKKEQEFVNENLSKVVSFIEKLDAKTNAAGAEPSKQNTGRNMSRQSRKSGAGPSTKNNTSMRNPYGGNNSIQEEDDEEDDEQ